MYYYVKTEVPEVLEMLSKLAEKYGRRRNNPGLGPKEPTFWFNESMFNDHCDLNYNWCGHKKLSVEEAINLLKEEKLMVGSYEVTLSGDGVKVGCQQVTLKEIKKIVDKMGFFLQKKE